MLQGKTVLVDGATGYIGTHVVRQLLREGASVLALVRPASSMEDREFLLRSGARLVEADLVGGAQEKRRLAEAFAQCYGAVHLIGSVAPRRGETLEQLHQEQTQAFSQWCLRAAVEGNLRKALMVTALGAAPDSPSVYLRTKYQAEQIFFSTLDEKSDLIDCRVLRPSLVVGRQAGRRDSKLINRYRTIIAGRPVVPLVGGGMNIVQPLFVGELAEAVARCLVIAESRDLSGHLSGSIISPMNNMHRVSELGGLEKTPMHGIVAYLMKQSASPKKMITLPLPVAKVVATVMEKVQSSPLVSVDQVTLATIDMVTRHNDLPRLLGREPLNWPEALDSYIKLEEAHCRV